METTVVSFFSDGIYAGMAINSSTCLCSLDIESFISHKASKQWAKSRWDLAKNCNNPSSYEIYKKNGICGTNIMKYTKEELIAWARFPIKDKVEGMLLRSSRVTATQCILNCESRGYQIALPFSAKQTCFCSNYASLFTKNDLATLGKRRRSTKVYTVPVYRTMNEDPACTIRFANLTSGSPIALASVPGSGNTWIRHLLEVSTGVYTGSVYHDNSLYKGGFLGEITAKNLANGVVVKDHLQVGEEIRPEFRSAIVLIRDPRDAMLAEWSRVKSSSHTGLPAAKVFSGEEFAKRAKRSATMWMKRIIMALTQKWDILVIYYEHLRESPVREMRRVTKFLKLNSIDHKENFEKRLTCMQLDLVGSFKRPPRKLDFNPFTTSSLKAFNKSIKRVNETLKEHHFPPLPTSYLS